jgi:hypothetical protein
MSLLTSCFCATRACQCNSPLGICRRSINHSSCIKMPYSCVYCGKTNTFNSSSALEKHLVFCSEVPGKKKSQLSHQVSVGLLKRVSDASPCNQQKRARYQNEDSHGSADKDDDNRGEGLSQPQDYNLMPNEVDICSVSTKQIFDSTCLIRHSQKMSNPLV